MYDACVVVAGSAKAAKRIMPNGLDYTDAFINQSYWRPENLTVRKLGPSTGRFKAGKVICASFNAG